MGTAFPGYTQAESRVPPDTQLRESMDVTRVVMAFDQAAGDLLPGIIGGRLSIHDGYGEPASVVDFTGGTGLPHRKDCAR